MTSGIMAFTIFPFFFRYQSKSPHMKNAHKVFLLITFVSYLLLYSMFALLS